MRSGDRDRPVDGDVGDELGLVHAVFPSSGGWTSDDGASRVKRAAWGKRTQPAVVDRARTPEPSSNRVRADSTRYDMERSDDGHPRGERERQRDSIMLPHTPSNPRRWVTPRPDYPTP